MATKRLKATKIQDAIQKAQRVGEAEEKFTIDGCEVVLRSLQPDEYQAILDEIADLEDAAYAKAYREGHLCRSLIEINGESLREYDFVEVESEEEVDGVKQLRPIAIERHKFVADYILRSWSIPAIDTAFRKFGDVLDKAEALAIDGIEFRLPDETPEDKFRRLLLEVKELEGQIPFELAGRMLNDAGYLSRSSKEELESVDQRLSRVAPETSSESPVAPLQTYSAQVADYDSSSAQRPPRVPLNQMPVSVPVPVTPPVTRAAPSEEVVVRPAAPAIPLSPDVMRRSRELEALEADPVASGGRSVQSSTRVAESVPGMPISSPAVQSGQARPDPNSLGAILDRKPVGGVNPRYRSPPRV
jgi:exonuclease VII small subunit